MPIILKMVDPFTAHWLRIQLGLAECYAYSAKLWF